MGMNMNKSRYFKNLIKRELYDPLILLVVGKYVGAGRSPDACQGILIIVIIIIVRPT